MAIWVAGSSNLDFVVRADHIPEPGETVLGRQFATFPGGKGANQAVAAARAGGVHTHFLTAMGADVYAQPLEASLQASGVEVHKQLFPDHATGTAFICVDDTGQNAITVAPGANMQLAAHHLPALQDASHLLMQLEISLPSVIAYAHRARQAGTQVVLNAAPAMQLPVELLHHVDVLIVNEGELRRVTHMHGSIAQCLSALQVPTVVVTLGHRGSLARQGDTMVYVPALQVHAVDTTGAGDTYCGVLVAALSQGVRLEDALRQATAAAALACTRAGAQSSIPTQSEVASFLNNANGAWETDTTALRQYCGLVTTH